MVKGAAAKKKNTTSTLARYLYGQRDAKTKLVLTPGDVHNETRVRKQRREADSYNPQEQKTAYNKVCPGCGLFMLLTSFALDDTFRHADDCKASTCGEQRCARCTDQRCGKCRYPAQKYCFCCHGRRANTRPGAIVRFHKPGCVHGIFLRDKICCSNNNLCVEDDGLHQAADLGHTCMPPRVDIPCSDEESMSESSVGEESDIGQDPPGMEIQVLVQTAD